MSWIAATSTTPASIAFTWLEPDLSAFSAWLF
jgi:hypothetical protein